MSLVKLIRHAEKGSDGNLSEAGRKIAVDYGSGIRESDPAWVMLTATSPAQRSVDTALLIEEGFVSHSPYARHLIEIASLQRMHPSFLRPDYTDEEAEAILSTSLPSYAHASLLHAPDVTFQYIKHTAEYIDGLSRWGDEKTLYVLVSHNPAIESLAFAVTGNPELLVDIDPLQGVTFDPYNKTFTPDYDPLHEVSCERLTDQISRYHEDVMAFIQELEE